jgi:hypothetical protein
LVGYSDLSERGAGNGLRWFDLAAACQLLLNLSRGDR